MPEGAPGISVAVPFSKEENDEFVKAIQAEGLALPPHGAVHMSRESPVHVYLLTDKEISDAADAVMARGMSIPSGPARQVLRASHAKLIAALMALHEARLHARSGGAAHA